MGAVAMGLFIPLLLGAAGGIIFALYLKRKGKTKPAGHEKCPQGAGRGDGEAMFALANALYCADRMEEALYWYEQAAQKGHVDAMLALAHGYEWRYWGGRDWEKVFKWYDMAAAHGSQLAAEALESLAPMRPQAREPRQGPEEAQRP